MQEKKILLASDHGGVALKNHLRDWLKAQSYQVLDFGPETDAESVDYPDQAMTLIHQMESDETLRGILICTTGIGMSMAANKHRGIRAAACSDTFSARLTRAHNDANVLCFGERVVGMGLAFDLVDNFIDTDFEGGKHQRRVDMITATEESESKNA